MTPIDPTEAAFALIRQSAPEQSTRLAGFRDRYAAVFHLVDSRPGIVLNANKDRVEYACKDMEVMWLLGFALWKSIELFAPTVLLPILTGMPAASALSLDEKLDEIERDYRERLAAVAALIRADASDAIAWPPDVPRPVASRTELSDPQAVLVFDLVVMATAVIFLHELKHMEFHAKYVDGIPRPENLAEEELQCDVWARDWFMSGLAACAVENGWEYAAVCSKRAMALLFACEYLRLGDQHMRPLISTDYPPLEARIAALWGAVNLPENDHFWVLSACVLFAEARRQGQRPALNRAAPKDIATRLMSLLTP